MSEGFRVLGGTAQSNRVYPFACASLSVSLRYLPWTDIIENSAISENTMLVLGKPWKLLRIYYLGIRLAGGLGATTIGLHLNGNTTAFTTRFLADGGQYVMNTENFETDAAVPNFSASDKFTISIDVTGSASDIVGCAHIRLLE